MSAVLGTAAVLLRADSSGLRGDLSKSKGVISAALGSLASGPMALVTAGLAAATAGVGAFAVGMAGAMRTISEGVEDFRNAEVAARRLDAVLKATGGAAGYSAEQLQTMADNLEATTTHDADSILNLQSKLLTFKAVQGEVFQEAVKLSLDLADDGFGSAEGAAVQLGKALEDPVKGIGALTRVGVSFNEQQKKQIASFVEANELAKAQAIVLEAVAGQVGGVSEALGKTDFGRATILTNQIGKFREELGRIFSPIANKFLEIKLAAVKAFAGLAGTIAPFLSKAAEFVKEFVIDAIEWIRAGAENFGLIWNKLPDVLGLAFRTYLGILNWFWRDAFPTVAGYGLRKALDLLVEWSKQAGKIMLSAVQGIGNAIASLPKIAWNKITGQSEDMFDDLMAEVTKPMRKFVEGFSGKGKIEFKKAFSESIKKEWEDLFKNDFAPIVARKAELERERKAGPEIKEVGPAKPPKLGGGDAPVGRDWTKIFPTGFSGFDQLGRTIQENLLKEKAAAAAERTADAAEGMAVGIGAIEMHSKLSVDLLRKIESKPPAGLAEGTA